MRRFLESMQKRSQFSRIHGIFVLLFFIFVIAGGAYLAGYTQILNVRAQTPGPNGRGFLWTDTFGWISMNCTNDWDRDVATAPTECTTGPGGNYGVTVSVSEVLMGEITGHGWSPNAGLVCFGSTCSQYGLRPDGSAPTATFDLNRENLEERTVGGVTRSIAFIEGWARVIAHRNEGGANQGGWIALNGTARGGTPIELGAWVNSENGALTISGSGWQQNPDQTGAGWIFFGDPPPGNAPCTPEQGRDCDTQCDPADPACQVELIPTNERECGTPENPQTAAQCCSNSVDDDHDESYTDNPDGNPVSGVDCLDYDCAGLRFYSTTYSPEFTEATDDYRHCNSVPGGGNIESILDPADCFDGHDNDLDRQIDCDDPDCANAVFGGQRCTQLECQEGIYNGCYDGFDNNGDGLVDCADPECNSGVCGYVLCPSFFSQCVCSTHERAAELAAQYGISPRDCVSDPDPAVDDDDDNDGIHDSCDNCPNDQNPNQEDTDADGRQVSSTTGGDACDPIAWLETRQGSIYARSISGTPPPPSPTSTLYTATYCILTSGASVPFAFQSRSCDLSSTDPSSRVAEFKLRQYTDTFALVGETLAAQLRTRLDVAGLRSGRYGTVKNITASTVGASDIAEPENEVKVYTHSGNLEISGNVTFGNGNGRINPGARIIIVENGNLTISGDLAYELVSQVIDRGDLASIAFVVIGGDINVSPTVTNLAGTFVTSGTFRSGSSQNPLDVSGLIVAKQFDFGRQFSSVDRGAERVTYDGRVALNTPPGLADFLKTLPEFRIVAPR